MRTAVILALASQYGRYGYRRITVLLREVVRDWIAAVGAKTAYIEPWSP